MFYNINIRLRVFYVCVWKYTIYNLVVGSERWNQSKNCALMFEKDKKGIREKYQYCVCVCVMGMFIVLCVCVSDEALISLSRELFPYKKDQKAKLSVLYIYDHIWQKGEEENHLLRWRDFCDAHHHFISQTGRGGEMCDVGWILKQKERRAISPPATERHILIII